MNSDRSEFTALVLLVDDQEWTSRSIESVLRPKGHVVVKAYTGRQALDLVPKVNPDAIIVDFHLPDIDGIDVTRKLRAQSSLHAVTPFFMISSSSVGRAERLEALSAGVWDILRHPIDPNELILRMETFIRAKQEADRIREAGLTDPVTGFYNVRGLLRRARELSAESHRARRPLSCIAIGPQFLDQVDGFEGGEANATELVAALQAATRVSDTVGRLGHGEFVIVAPGADEEGAVQLADRIMEFLRASGAPGAWPPSVTVPGRPDIKLRVGVYAAAEDEAVSPEDLLLKATTALRRAQADEDGPFRIRSYSA